MATRLKDLSSIDHAELLSRRKRLAPTAPEQEELAHAEHRAFAREWVQEKPVLAALSLPFAIPAYTGAKFVGQRLGIPYVDNPETTRASFREMGEAYKGLGEGFLSMMKRRKEQLGKLYRLAYRK